MQMSDPAQAVYDFVSKSTGNGSSGFVHLCGTGAVAELEAKLRIHYGMNHALCVSNGSLGLMTIAVALGLRDTAFITTPSTYGASIAGWLLLGNKPVFADIDPMTLTLEPGSVEKAITRDTKAILSVDIFGNPCDMAGLRRIADEHGLWYIADCAQSLGARRDSKQSGSLADALVVSFTVGKPLFAGEGGAILTNNTALYNRLLWFSQHPLRQRRELGLRLDNEFAINARIHPLAAIWANSVFEQSLEAVTVRRQGYFELIKALNQIGLTEEIRFVEDSIEPTFFRFTAAWKRRPCEARLVKALRKCSLNVGLEPFPIRLLYRQSSFLAQYGKSVKHVYCTEAERQHRTRFCMAISMHTETPKQQSVNEGDFAGTCNES